MPLRIDLLLKRRRAFLHLFYSFPELSLIHILFAAYQDTAQMAMNEHKLVSMETYLSEKEMCIRDSILTVKIAISASLLPEIVLC